MENSVRNEELAAEQCELGQIEYEASYAVSHAIADESEPPITKEVYDEVPEGVFTDGDKYIPTQEEVCDAIIYDLRDNVQFMSEAQKAYLKSVVDEMMAAATPKERLYIEINDLLERINKLDAFMKKRDENGIRVIQKMGLTEAAIHLMSKQLECEKELNDILVARYSIFDVKKGE